ncbi:PE domain-containing protein [Amycolatopsis silviterrae]|uniref:PE domain-containing protein n=1 Tax=Amycolatopsis silviterrae TaxID=1656914 RepID=A0ABW5GZJ7_9PSEU
MTDNQQPHLPPARRYGGASFETLAVAPLLGDGYSYDKATLEEIARSYEDLGDSYSLDQTRARLIAQTQPPGLDFSSVGNAELFRNSGRSLLDSLNQCEQFCRHQATKYREALKKYSAAEDAHSSEIHNSGGSL